MQDRVRVPQIRSIDIVLAHECAWPSEKVALVRRHASLLRFFSASGRWIYSDFGTRGLRVTAVDPETAQDLLRSASEYAVVVTDHATARARAFAVPVFTCVQHIKRVLDIRDVRIQTVDALIRHLKDTCHEGSKGRQLCREKGGGRGPEAS